MSAIETIKELLDLANSVKNTGLYSKINELNKELIEYQQENLTLRKKNSELEEAIKRKETVVFEDHVYWTVKDEKKEGPFCPRCLDATEKLVRLNISEDGYRLCFNCTSGYGKGS